MIPLHRHSIKQNKQQVKIDKRMKVQLKQVLKSSFQKFHSMQQSQIIHQIGNCLRILEISKPDPDFLHLHPTTTQLLDFAVAANSRTVYTVEKQADDIELAAYYLGKDRKAMRLAEIGNWIDPALIDTVVLLTDQYESSCVYVMCRGKGEGTVSLVDGAKMKVVAHGFLGDWNGVSLCTDLGNQLSFCGKGFVRRMKATDWGWSVEDKLPKKLGSIEIFHTLWLPLGRCFMATKTTAYLVEETEIIQNFNITDQNESIFSIFAVPKGFVIVCDKGKILIFGEQGDDSLYSQMQQFKLNIKKSKVHQVQYNRKTQQLYISTTSGNFYRSKLDQTSTAGKENYFNFEQITLNHSHPQTGILTTALSHNYCLISSDKDVQLWDLTKLTPSICLQLQNTGHEKAVTSSSINPDGHSMCIGFSDRVRFYRILLNKFRQFGEYQLKYASLIQYSHGGQLVAISCGKGLNSSLSIVNTLNLREVMNAKIGFKPAQIIWNEHDDELAISGQDAKVISIYKISNKSKKILHFEQEITFIRFDYLTRKVMVSAGDEVHIVDSEHKIEAVIKPKIPNFNYIFPVQGMYVATDKNGGLYCSNTPDFQRYQYMHLFMNQKFQLMYKKEMLIAYSSPSDVMLLKLKCTPNTQQNKPDFSQNIVLVDREEIIKFFQKVKLLEDNLSQLQTSTSMKLDYERRKNLADLELQEKKFKEEIQDFQNKINLIIAEKSKQQKNNAKVFDELETGQVKSVHDLEKVYDMKLRMQKQKCLSLEQQKLQQKLKYQAMIEQLKDKHNNHVQKIRIQYSQDLQKQLKQMQGEKQRYNQYRKKVQTRIIDLEEEGQNTLFQLQFKKDDQIMNITEKYIKLERQYDAKVIALHNMEDSLNDMTAKYKESLEKIKKNQKIVQENINKVQILQKQIDKKNKVMQQKNLTIDQQSHQIDGLQKAKYVLSFRTTEVRKQLQPKQILIQKLKKEMFNLDEEYKNEVKKNYQLSQRAEKLEKLNMNFKKQNAEVKMQLKNRDRLYNDMCSEIFHIVNNTDAKQWNSSLVRIYQQYIKQQRLKGKGQKKDDSTSQQINRHLIHVEQSLHQVAIGNERMLKSKDQEVMRKMKENAQLVYDLNIMRKKENQLMNNIKEKDTEISRLKRELNQSLNVGRSTRANTAYTGITRRMPSRDAVNQNNSDWVDLSLKRPSENLPSERGKKNRVLSAHRTMAWRDQSRKQKTKISDIARELQSAKNTIMRQDRMIEQLNQRLLGMPDDQLE